MSRPRPYPHIFLSHVWCHLSEQTGQGETQGEDEREIVREREQMRKRERENVGRFTISNNIYIIRKYNCYFLVIVKTIQRTNQMW